MLYFYFLQWSNSKNTQAKGFYKGWRGLKDSKFSNLSLATSRQQPKSWCLWAELPHKVMNLDLQFVSEEFPSHFPCPPLKRPKLVTKAHTLDWQTGCQKTLILRIWGHLGPVWERRLNCCLSIKVTGLHQTWRVFPLIFLVWGDNWMGQYRFRYQDHNLNVRRKGVIEWDQAHHSKKIIPQTILNSFLNLSPTNSRLLSFEYGFVEYGFAVHGFSILSHPLW